MSVSNYYLLLCFDLFVNRLDIETIYVPKLYLNFLIVSV